MYKLKCYQRTFLYTMLHLVVDGICATIIFSKLYTNSYEQSLAVFLIYNGFAFLSQPLVGIFIDRYDQPKLFLMLTLLGLSLGFLFQFQGILSAICLGIGNSFFHVCGGKDVTLHTKNDILSLGIFVSTGAVGLMLGQRYYSMMLLILFFTVLFLLSLILLLDKSEIKMEEKECRRSERIPILLFIGIIIVVVIRSFVGKIIPFAFTPTEIVFVFIAIATCLGKMLGGVCAKYIGIRKTIVVSMILAIICLSIWNTNPYTISIGIFFFNFSMPITLYYANKFAKGKEGLAFGSLAAALIPGYLLGMIPYPDLVSKILIVGLSVLSIGIVLSIPHRKKNYETL